METFSALLAICVGNSPITGEFPAQRPVTRSFDVFFDLRLKTRLSKQSFGWWFETPSRSLWRHCNVKELVWHVFPYALGCVKSINSWSKSICMSCMKYMAKLMLRNLFEERHICMGYCRTEPQGAFHCGNPRRISKILSLGTDYTTYTRVHKFNTLKEILPSHWKTGLRRPDYYPLYSLVPQLAIILYHQRLHRFVSPLIRYVVYQPLDYSRLDYNWFDAQWSVCSYATDD